VICLQLNGTFARSKKKCREQQQDLYMTFIDLTKAFDTVNQNGLQKVLKQIGCAKKFIRELHEGMMVQVLDSGVFIRPVLCLQ